MQVFPANLVEGANDPALEDAPEALNRVGMDRADDVLVPRVVDSGVREGLFEIAIAGPLIGAEQADLVRNGFDSHAPTGPALCPFAARQSSQSDYNSFACAGG